MYSRCGLHQFTGQFYAAYCPSVSGCRAPIIFEEGGNTTDLIYPDVTLLFNSTSPDPVWVVSRACVKYSVVREEFWT